MTRYKTIEDVKDAIRAVGRAATVTEINMHLGMSKHSAICSAMRKALLAGEVVLVGERLPHTPKRMANKKARYYGIPGELESMEDAEPDGVESAIMDYLGKGSANAKHISFVLEMPLDQARKRLSVLYKEHKVDRYVVGGEYWWEVA